MSCRWEANEKQIRPSTLLQKVGQRVGPSISYWSLSLFYLQAPHLCQQAFVCGFSTSPACDHTSPAKCGQQPQFWVGSGSPNLRLWHFSSSTWTMAKKLWHGPSELACTEKLEGSGPRMAYLIVGSDDDLFVIPRENTCRAKAHIPLATLHSQNKWQLVSILYLKHVWHGSPLPLYGRICILHSLVVGNKVLFVVQWEKQEFKQFYLFTTLQRNDNFLCSLTV